MTKIGGFGYCAHKEHAYVTFYQTEEGQVVELLGERSRPVPNLFSQDDKGNYTAWVLVKELEKGV